MGCNRRRISSRFNSDGFSCHLEFVHFATVSEFILHGIYDGHNINVKSVEKLPFVIEFENEEDYKAFLAEEE